MEFEWNILSRFSTVQFNIKVQEILSNTDTEPENYKEGIIFISMYNDMSWTSKKMNGNANWALCRLLSIQEMVIPRVWITKERVYYSRIQTFKRMGKSCWTNDDGILSKGTPIFVNQLSVHGTPHNCTRDVRRPVFLVQSDPLFSKNSFYVTTYTFDRLFDAKRYFAKTNKESSGNFVLTNSWDYMTSGSRILDISVGSKR